MAKKKKSAKKESILNNYKYIYFDASADRAYLINKKDLKIMTEDDNVSEGDLIVELTEEYLKVAEQINHIELV